jgi:hypothetical protein
MFTGLAAVSVVSGSLVAGVPAGALVAQAASVQIPRTSPPILVPPPPNAPHATKNYESAYTANWSGYAQKVSTATGPYTAVRDYWTVPQVDTGLSGDQYSSDWVGIDGFGNNYLVQDGTEADNINGKAKYYAWTELIPAYPVIISGLTIKPGDQMEGLVEETSKNVWKMTVYDLATGKHGGPPPVTYDASNATVEAIHERPCLSKCDPGQTAVYADLTQTTNVTFDPGFYSTGTYTPKWKPLLAAAPRATVDRIFMYNGHDTPTIASPSVPSAHKGFTVADGAAAPSAPWGTAEEVPGLAALNTGGAAQVLSVSCAAPGECSAGGYYADSLNDQQGFVVNETDGSWGTAEEVPGLAAVNGGDAQVLSVSCAAAGECSAVGYYTDTSDDQQGFVVDETDGSWGTAEEVHGLATLNTAGAAQVLSVSCAAAGECSAGGYYTVLNSPYTNYEEGFVVSETGGVWGTAEEVPAYSGFSQSMGVSSVSCAAVGGCTAGGYYWPPGDGNGRQGFLVTETGGVWGLAQNVPYLANLNTGGDAAVLSVSCKAVGDCAAGGYYFDFGAGADELQGFVVSETDGSWNGAEPISGLVPVNGGTAEVLSVSCGAAGECRAGGYTYTPSQQGYVVNETGGSGARRKRPGRRCHRCHAPQRATAAPAACPTW